jgi:hypothetical protein
VAGMIRSMDPAEWEGDRGPDRVTRDTVRCRCLQCGAHAYAIAVGGGRLNGHCGNCGGNELILVENGEVPGARRENDFEDRSIDA